jgi:hypothetical protein
MLGAVPGQAGDSPDLVRRWESLPTGVQGGVAFAVFAALLLLVNLAVFNQPLWRAILYGVIEGATLTGLLLVATANERRKRRSGDQDEHDRERR